MVVRVELTEANRGVGVWSERFDRTSASVLDVIDDVARGVATGVAGQLLPDETADLARRPSADPVAYEHFVRGNLYLARRTPASFARAISEYEAAAARDTSMKVGVARIAYTYALGVAIGVGDLPNDTVKARSVAAIARAKREAPEVAETWMAEGFRDVMRSVFEREDRIDVGVSQLARGVQLDPRNAEAHHQYAQGLVLQGADSAALAEYRAAIELEPGRAVSAEELARHHILLGRYPDARAWGDSAVAWDPQMPRAWLVRARARLGLGDIPGADRDVAMAATLNAQGRNATEALAMHAMVLAAQGDTLHARGLLAPIAGTYTIYGFEGVVAVGWPDRALDDIEQRAIGATRCYLLRFPLVAALRGTAHFDRIAAGCR
jgi:tetratricopeptide (TPR) repeat protein